MTRRTILCLLAALFAATALPGCVYRDRDDRWRHGGGDWDRGRSGWREHDAWDHYHSRDHDRWVYNHRGWW